MRRRTGRASLPAGAVVVIGVSLTACSTSPTGAVTGELLGIACNAHPISGQVRLIGVRSGQRIGRKVGRDGRFRITGLPVGTYRIKCSPLNLHQFWGADWRYRPVHVAVDRTTTVDCVFPDGGQP